MILTSLLLACGGASGTGTDKQTTTTTLPPPTPVITLSQSNVTASLQAGSAASSYDIILSAGNASPVAAINVQDASTTSSAAWLSFTLSQATAPSTLSVRITPGSLTAGTYTGALRISATNAVPVTVQVNLVVTAPPVHTKLVLDKTTLAVASDLATPIPVQNIAVTSVNGDVSGLTVSSPTCTQSLSPWLTIALSSATTPATISLTFKQAGLAMVGYSCTFTVSTSQPGVDSASQDVAVSMLLKTIPRIGVSRDTVPMTAYTGQGAAPATFSISNSGSGSLPSNSLSLGAVSYGAGGSGWLNTSLAGSIATLTAPNAGTLAVGTYYATIPVQSTATDVANSPRPVVVVLTVLPPPPTLIPTPASFTFSWKAGTTPSLKGGFVVTSSVSTPFTGVYMLPNPFSGSTIPWISLNMSYFWACPTVASPSPGSRTTPCELQFTLNPPSNLPPGNYSFSFDINTQPSTAYTAVPVSVTVTP